MALVSGSVLGLAALGKMLAAGGGLKAGAAIGAAAKLKAGALAAGGTLASGAAKQGASRMAADAMFKGGLGKAVFGNMSKGDIASRLAPDAFFGGMAALQTPGDIGDKLIAGGTSALGGGLGGIALSRGASRMGMEGMGNYIADMAGSVGGDMIGMGAGETLMRGKDMIGGGTGQTPYERMGAEQQAQFAEQIRRQTLAGMGLMPGAQERYFDNSGMY